jgi:hypothetical protein
MNIQWCIFLVLQLYQWLQSKSSSPLNDHQCEYVALLHDHKANMGCCFVDWRHSYCMKGPKNSYGNRLYWYFSMAADITELYVLTCSFCNIDLKSEAWWSIFVYLFTYLFENCYTKADKRLIVTVTYDILRDVYIAIDVSYAFYEYKINIWLMSNMATWRYVKYGDFVKSGPCQHALPRYHLPKRCGWLTNHSLKAGDIWIIYADKWMITFMLQ